MRGLLLKDIYVLWGAMKIPFAALFICTLIPAGNVYVITMLVSAMLPVTSFLYDEQTRWYPIQTSMPYKKRDIVMSKYFLGMLTIATATILSVGGQALMKAIIGKPITLGEVYMILGTTVMCMLVQSLLIPLSFRYGAERARVAMVLLIGATTGLWILILSAIAPQLRGVQFNISMPLSFIGVTLLFYGVSIIATAKLYRKQQ